MAYEDYLIREATEGPPADWSDSPVDYCNQCDPAVELCACEKDTSSSDRQDLINNLSGEQPVARYAGNSTVAGNTGGLTEPTAQTLPDTWEAIEAQLDHWAEMDKQYWEQRKEKAYAAWMERTYGLPTT